jgi:hypothetical protein
MTRIEIATIFATLSLSAYIFAAGITAILLGPLAVQHSLMLPLSLVEDFFGGLLPGSKFGRDLLTALSLWLTFVCIIDLSVLISSIKIVKSFATAVSHIKHPLFGLRGRLARL